MENKKLLYEEINHLNLDFPVIFHYNNLSRDHKFRKHWHEKLEFLYFVKGEGIVSCNAKRIPVSPGVLAVVNSNEMHDITAITEKLEYYCIIIDNLLFKSLHTDICETKYINPIYCNLILFENRVENDHSVNECIKSIIDEFKVKATGYELSVKSYIFRLIVLLLRNYTNRLLTPQEYNARVKNLNIINSVLQYMEKNFNEAITVEELSKKAQLSKYYFLRLFKKTTGKSVIDYLNYVRINKAEEILAQSDKNIIETAFLCGFNDANYFSRVFKKYKGVSPSRIRLNNLHQ